MRRRLIVVMLGLSASSCGPETKVGPSAEAQRYAAAICGARSTCGCVQRFPSDEACESELTRRFALAAKGHDVALECLARLEEDGGVGLCASVDNGGASGLCPLLVADIGEGGRCRQHFELPMAFVNDCAVGLTCRDSGTCERSGSPPAQKNEGDACFSDAPGTCPAFDLYCAPDDRCHLSGTEGASCSSPFACYEHGKSLGCAGIASGSGACTTKPAVGEPCNPLDFSGCALTLGGDEPGFNWCNPASNTCESGRTPLLCEALDYPLAWP